MKGVTTFLITVNKHDVEKLRQQIKQLGHIWTEQDWTPRRGCHAYRKQKQMVAELEEELMWDFCSISSNREFLTD